MKKNILVIDDSSNIRKLVEFFLRSKGYSVVSAENGQEGLERLHQMPFDAIVLDINMPNMDGFEFLKIIKSDKAYRQISVVMLTAEDQDRDKEEAIKLGATGYLVKPFKTKELISLIEKVLG